MGWYGVMDHLLGRGKPRFYLGGVESRTKPAEGILSTEPTSVHAGDFSHRHVILQPTTMRKTGAADQAVEREGLEDVGHRRSVGAGARQGVAPRDLGEHPAVLQKVIPRHQSTISGECLITSAKVKLPTRRQEFEIQISFTRWVNQLLARFCFQTPLPLALALPILNLNCGLEDEPHDNQYENTIFIVASDNGLSLGEHGLIGKQNIYESGGMQVPLLFAGPGIKQGETEALAYLYDVYPTMCQLAGIPVPEGLDAKSLVPVIKGEQPRVRDVLVSAYMDCQRSIRDERWKLIRYPLIDKTQLFDLQADPHEMTDLSANPEHAAKIAELTALLETTRQELGDTAPLVVANPQKAEWSVPAVIPTWQEQVKARAKAAKKDRKE